MEPQPTQASAMAWVGNSTRPATVAVCVALGTAQADAEALVQSLLAQDARPMEVLLPYSHEEMPGVGGVLEATEEMMEAAGFAGVRRIAAGAGVGAQMNACAGEAAASHVLFVGAGQVLMADALRVLTSAAETQGGDVVTSHAAFYTGPPAAALAGALAQAPESWAGEVVGASDAFAVTPTGGVKLFPFLFLGPARHSGLYQNVFGGPMFLARKDTFRALGGVDASLEGLHLHWHFYARAACGGHALEVVPWATYLCPLTPEYYRKAARGAELAKRRQALGAPLAGVPEDIHGAVLRMDPATVPSIAALRLGCEEACREGEGEGEGE